MPEEKNDTQKINKLPTKHLAEEKDTASESENIQDQKQARWMRKVVFYSMLVVCLLFLSIFLWILFFEYNYYKLMLVSHYSIVIVVLSAVLPTMSLCYLACCVFRGGGSSNTNIIASLLSQLIRIFKKNN